MTVDSAPHRANQHAHTLLRIAHRRPAVSLAGRDVNASGRLASMHGDVPAARPRARPRRAATTVAVVLGALGLAPLAAPASAFAATPAAAAAPAVGRATACVPPSIGLPATAPRCAGWRPDDVRAPTTPRDVLAPTSITTTASSSVALDAGTLSDVAIVKGRIDPQPGATVDFRLYGPGDATCDAAPVFQALGVPYPQAGGDVSSDAFTPSAAGTYRWVATYGGDATNAPSVGVCGDATEIAVVRPATPAIATTAAASLPLGAGTMTDSATVTGRSHPVSGATLDFALYGPDDPTCTSTPVFTSDGVPYPAAGGAVQSAAYTPTQTGTFRWITRYNGDANNNGVSAACDAPNEATVVTPSRPTIATTASPDVALGAGALTDSVTVNGRVGSYDGATVDFRLYGPDDATCAAAPVFVSLGLPYDASGGAVTSDAFVAVRSGTYRWVAAYSGDPDNAAATGACGDAGETVVVARATPTLTASASSDVVIGAGSLTDTATVAGRAAPLPGATIDFRLYGPDDATCSAAPVFASLGVPYPVAGGPVSSQPFTPALAGTYRWVASYSGDADNAPVAGSCESPGQSARATVAPPALTLATTASPGIALGAGTLSDSATVLQRTNPVDGATITFRLYGPNDATCAATPAFTSAAVAYPVAGGPVASPALTPQRAGTYRWVASYGGDANNPPVTGTCNAAGETTVVARANPSISGAASGDVQLGGGPLTDSATVTGRVNPLAGATIDFRLYGPADPTCSATPVFKSLKVAYPATGGPVSSEAFTPTQAGAYAWVASYGGDANNAPVATTCNATRTRSAVTAATPPQPPAAPVTPATPPPPPAPVVPAVTPTPTAPVAPAPPPAKPRKKHAPRKHHTAPTQPPAPFQSVVHDTPPNQSRYGAYDPRSEPRKTIAILVAAFALLQLASSGGAARSGGGSDGGAGGGSGSGGQSAPSFDLDYEGVEVEFLAPVAFGDALGTFNWPGTAAVDGLAIYLGTRLAPRSPLLARIVADGTAMRSIFGSASQVLPLAGLVLGILAVRSSHSEAIPPSTALTIAIAMASVIDAGAGMVAVLTFLIGVSVSGGVHSGSDVRLLLGLAALWAVVPVLAGAARPLRRHSKRDLEGYWERSSDFVIASLIGGWAVQKIVLALPGLAGQLLPIAKHSSLAALCVIAALCIRMVVETVAAHMYPARLERAAPGELDEPGPLQRVGASLVRTVVFVFLAYVIVGTSWQLWVGSALFVIPQVLAVFAERFPNSAALYRVLPKGLVELVIMLFVGTAFGALLIALMNDKAHDFLANSFVLLSLPGFALSIIGLVGREGEDRDIGWAKQVGGAVLVVLGFLLVEGLLP